jgi:hypothetical protein
MFFMGGVTLGYLHPPARDKREDVADTASKDTAFDPAKAPVSPGTADGALERTLLWARRLLC